MVQNGFKMSSWDTFCTPIRRGRIFIKPGQTSRKVCSWLVSPIWLFFYGKYCRSGQHEPTYKWGHCSAVLVVKIMLIFRCFCLFIGYWDTVVIGCFLDSCFIIVSRFWLSLCIGLKKNPSTWCFMNLSGLQSTQVSNQISIDFRSMRRYLQELSPCISAAWNLDE